MGYDKETEEGITIKQQGGEVATILSYGIVENLDIVLGMPYQWSKVKEDGEVTSEENGVSDMSLEVKWRFFEKDGLSLALKPGVSFPTGDEEKGLGAGKTAYSLFFIATKEIEPWVFHLNLGYIRNENNADERENLWHVSAAAHVKATENLGIVANIGIERNTDSVVNTHPAFVLGGVIYSIAENLDVDLGTKVGLNEPETDMTFLAGLAWRF